jgi:flagellar motor switch protein FliG
MALISPPSSRLFVWVPLLGGLIADPSVYEDLKGILGTLKRNEILKAIPNFWATALNNHPTLGQILNELDTEFRGHLERVQSEHQTKVDGKEAATGILKRLAQDQSQALLEELAATDATMADELQQALFTFADLNRMDARGMQQLLKEVPTDQLVLALKSASEELKNKVFANLSSRAADMLREDLALLGPTRIADVEAAQRAIVEAALQLERDGRVTIARDGGGGVDGRAALVHGDDGDGGGQALELVHARHRPSG